MPFQLSKRQGDDENLYVCFSKEVIEKEPPVWVALPWVYKMWLY